MITINLLPVELRPVKRTPLPYLACASVFVLAMGFCGMTYIANLAGIIGVNSKLAKNHTELEGLQDVVNEYNSLTEKKRQLAIQVKTISDISSDRIIWSRQLFNLGRLAPDNLWYDAITVSSKPFTVSSKVYNPQTKTMETKIDRITKRVLTLTGYVVPGTDGQASISPYTISTSADEEFIKLFRLDRSTFEDTEFEDNNVKEFKLEYIIERGGAENE